jgi:hypothetical protein
MRTMMLVIGTTMMLIESEPRPTIIPADIVSEDKELTTAASCQKHLSTGISLAVIGGRKQGRSFYTHDETVRDPAVKSRYTFEPRGRRPTGSARPS